MAVATSEASARVGTGLSIMDSSICVATITGLPARRQPRTARFWIAGTCSAGSSTPRSPRATISASAWAMISSSRSTAEGFSSLAMMRARSPIRSRASMMSSGRCGTARSSRRPAPAPCPGRAGPGRERGDRQHHARHVDALAVGQSSAHQHLGIRAGRVAGVDAQAQAAVVQQQLGAGHQRGEDLGVGQTDALGVAGARVQVQAEALAGLQLRRPLREGAHAQLGALQVGHHADGAAGLDLDLAQDGHADRVILGAAVAEVQPEHVHAGMEQAAEGVAVAAGRTQRGDDLGAAVAA